MRRGWAREAARAPRMQLMQDEPARRRRLGATRLPLPRSARPASTALNYKSDAGPLDRLNCFASNEAAAVRLERLGSRRIELRLSRPFTPPRGRVNCTLPTADGRFHWFGQQYYVPR